MTGFAFHDEIKPRTKFWVSQIENSICGGAQKIDPKLSCVGKNKRNFLNFCFHLKGLKNEILWVLIASQITKWKV